MKKLSRRNWDRRNHLSKSIILRKFKKRYFIESSSFYQISRSSIIVSFKSKTDNSQLFRIVERSLFPWLDVRHHRLLSKDSKLRPSTQEQKHADCLSRFDAEFIFGYDLR
jgi:hypothetical protein